MYQLELSYQAPFSKYQFDILGRYCVREMATEIQGTRARDRKKKCYASKFMVHGFICSRSSSQQQTDRYAFDRHYYLSLIHI